MRAVLLATTIIRQAITTKFLDDAGVERFHRREIGTSDRRRRKAPLQIGLSEIVAEHA